MAKLNWQKINQQTKQQTINERSRTSVYFSLEENNLWSLHGKYYGIHYGKLPVDYLFWILENTKSTKHKSIAESEIYKRYRETTNT